MYWHRSAVLRIHFILIQIQDPPSPPQKKNGSRTGHKHFFKISDFNNNLNMV